MNDRPIRIHVDIEELPRLFEWRVFGIRTTYENPPNSPALYADKHIRLRRDICGDDLIKPVSEALLDTFALKFGMDGERDAQPWRGVWLAYRLAIKKEMARAIQVGLAERTTTVEKWAAA